MLFSQVLCVGEGKHSQPTLHTRKLKLYEILEGTRDAVRRCPVVTDKKLFELIVEICCHQYVTFVRIR